MEIMQSYSPLVTIAICTYNGEQFLEETLRSVLNQTYSNYEVVIVDDGSSDRTVSIVKQFVSNDSRIRLFIRGNSGLAASRNFAFKEAKGEWIAIIDQDDLCYPDRLEHQLRVADLNPSAGLIFSNTDYIDVNGKIFDNHLSKFRLPERIIPRIKASDLLLLQGCFVDSEACFVRKSLFEKAGLLNEKLRYACDYDYFIRLGFCTDFAYSSEKLSAWRVHEKQQTAVNNKRYMETRQVLLSYILHNNVSAKTRFILGLKIAKSILIEFNLKIKEKVKKKK